MDLHVKIPSSINRIDVMKFQTFKNTLLVPVMGNAVYKSFRETMILRMSMNFIKFSPIKPDAMLITHVDHNAVHFFHIKPLLAYRAVH